MKKSSHLLTLKATHVVIIFTNNGYQEHKNYVGRSGECAGQERVVFPMRSL